MDATELYKKTTLKVLPFGVVFARCTARKKVGQN